MFKNKLSENALMEIAKLFQEEVEQKVSHTETVKNKIKCHSSFVSNLRSKWRKNGVIVLSNNKVLIKELQKKAIEKDSKYFVAPNNCLKCKKSNLRYTSTTACVQCAKDRIDSKNNKSYDIPINNQPPAIPLLEEQSLIKAGIRCF